MNNQTINVFDLLGNLANLSGELTSGITPLSDTPEISFEQLLSGMLGLESLDNNNPMQQLPFAKLLNQEVESNFGSITGTKNENQLDPKIYKNILFDNIIPQTKTGVNNTDQPVIVEDETQYETIINDPKIDLNRLAGVINQQTTILEPTQLENKAYQVVSAEAVDNELNLVLIDAANPEQTIKVKLPLEMIEKGLDGTYKIDNNRVDVTAVNQNQIEKLFHDLKVDQIEISSANIDGIDIDDETADNNRVKIDFIDTKSANQVSAILDKENLNPVNVKKVQFNQASQLNNQDRLVLDNSSREDVNQSKNELELKEKTQSTATVANKISGTVIDDLPKPIVNVSAKNNTLGKAAVLDESNSFTKNEKFDLLGITDTTNRPMVKITGENGMIQNQNKPFDFNGMLKTDQTIIKTDAETNGFINTEKFDFDISYNNKETSVQPVRITLPENLTAAQKTGHQSIQLNIHPDDLGPAKLHLSLTHDDKLRARVMVNSPEAKVVLEQSIDRLVDQLNKINIKVDLININVASGNSQEQMFSRQSNWHRQMTNRKLGQDKNLDMKDHIHPQLAGSLGVVNASGVNVLA